MPTMTSYAPGTPSWVDLGTTDAEGAREFYRRVFGWELEVGPPEMGFYTMARMQGQNVAGMMELSAEQQAQGIPPIWTTYFSTDDADGLAKRITDRGGTVTMGPMEVMDLGRMVIAIDPTGAPFGLWQPGSHPGAGLANEPGSLIWSELSTSDQPAAISFYTEVFGFNTEEMEVGAPTPYVMFKVGDHEIGGSMTASTNGPVGTPSYWLTYFATADTDASVAAAEAAGGTVLSPATDSPYGRLAVLQDPQGAVFAVISVPNSA